jgi:hypothetical protein
MDMSSRCIIVSCLVVFDEFVLDFLMQGLSPTSAPPPSSIEWPCITLLAPSFSEVGQPNLQDPAIIYVGLM